MCIINESIFLLSIKPVDARFIMELFKAPQDKQNSVINKMENSAKSLHRIFANIMISCLNANIFKYECQKSLSNS